MNSKIFLTLLGFLLPTIVLAQGSVPFTPLVGLPGINPMDDFNGYINSLYGLAISIAALIAVIKIIIAGVKWMLSDVVTSKQSAKSEIEESLLGLLIIAAAFLILNEINPQLTQTNLFTTTVSDVTPSGTGSNGGGTPPLGSGGNTGGGNTTNPNPGTAPTGSITSGYYPIGTYPETYLPGRRPPAPTQIDCSSDSSRAGCTRQYDECRQNGGTILQTSPRVGVFYCSRVVEKQFLCREYVVGDETGQKMRNCTGELSQCYNLTEEFQRSAWISGSFRCLADR